MKINYDNKKKVSIFALTKNEESSLLEADVV